ncbi:MAG: hypothetical protein A2268_11580 [Candidatus Raymondbacteria bacterium RifOxyA12_full_50_37]|uniref:dUTP diphosphatase n=1 Tax=Candidatus Raymondbacteria bacterium RIFOXYD12_FULL_49_13 TaxID=1817890 RepID=A0A1F7F3C4_UNCRA|nr:MAG: hypothetical protein A2268_11580 [Candidatus Raymondbacteria bacterium RifOxyA12_full_50_37]OGJ85978.1 MAG: hypothetical protein A2248_00415 [Candidatus Raymondbacteria bacterium RIFOXYA2_FULL_49_16]OGJ90084.1 MAG: hypothetical protein A2350_07955 [Candidatus Raymondbacteria bacterium RifOxyB12_full_50_8]OGJ97140.1 MAG: hypothetical protein A2453_12505 [Candidatus Raymondbacteria bacterium RIFOXYC2_FULL_50_21]OGK01159.1 MAG: hypothetical protein A2519_01390 [Candidatus Raymondbacteria b
MNGNAPVFTLKVKLLHPAAKLPERRDGDIGWDLFCVSTEESAPGLVKIKTGIAVELPSGYWGQVEGRSSMGVKGYDVHGGIIDNIYRGEIMVVLVVHNPSEKPAINPGDKIAQLIVRKQEDFGWTVEAVETLSQTERGAGGFGSTGR